MSRSPEEVEAIVVALRGEVATLTSRLRSVEDVQAIQTLKARYGELADARYTRKGRRSQAEIDRLADEIALLFAPDAVWDGGASLGLARGRDEIRERFSKPTLQFSWHYFVKPQIAVDGDAATAQWDILAPCTSDDGTAMWMAGLEKDTYRRVEGFWLHQSMELSVAFMAPHATGWAKRPSPS